MAALQHDDEHVHGQEPAGKALKRRGILAAAGAVVAGIVAKQASQPVAAGTDGDLTLGSVNTLVNGTNNHMTTLRVAASGFPDSYVLSVEASPDTTGHTSAIIGQGGESISLLPGIGVTGAGGGGTSGQFGGDGVRGIGGSNGTSTIDGIGVRGVSGSNHSGSIGVLGVTAAGAVNVAAPSVTSNTAGVFGLNHNVNGYGVQGMSTHSHGVYAEAGSDQGAGALVGVTRVSTGVAFQAAAISPAIQAGFFTGNVSVNGSLGVSGGKFAVVKGGDGQYRGMYAVESPECWFEDFGTGTLVGGKADVKLDPLFAQHVHTDDYHVFLTEHSDDHLHVQQKSGGGFTVQADTVLAKLKGKQASDLSGTFSWRVVAKRNDIKGERLPIWQMPAAPHIPDAQKELPPVIPPAKKP